MYNKPLYDNPLDYKPPYDEPLDDKPPENKGQNEELLYEYHPIGWLSYRMIVP